MSYASKWMEDTAEYQKIRVICPAKMVDTVLAASIADTAVRAFRAVGGWGMAASISGWTKTRAARAGGQLQPPSGRGGGAVPIGEEAGITYPDLMQQIITASFEGPPFDLDLPIHFSQGRKPKTAQRAPRECAAGAVSAPGVPFTP